VSPTPLEPARGCAGLDLDGSAGTRDPDDLVGQGTLARGGAAGGADVALRPRGVGGRLVTARDRAPPPT